MAIKAQEADQALVAAARREQEGGGMFTPGFNLLYIKYAGYIAFNVLTRYFQTTEQLVGGSNIVWTRIFNRIHNYKPCKGGFHTWARTVAENVCKEEMKLKAAETVEEELWQEFITEKFDNDYLDVGDKQ